MVMYDTAISAAMFPSQYAAEMYNQAYGIDTETLRYSMELVEIVEMYDLQRIRVYFNNLHISLQRQIWMVLQIVYFQEQLHRFVSLLQRIYIPVYRV